MIRKLRAKFIFYAMVIVSVMLAITFVLLYQQTRRSLTLDHLRTMELIGADPQEADINVPIGSGNWSASFVIERPMDSEELTVSGRSQYNLEDLSFLKELIIITDLSPQPSGEIEAYNLRYLKGINPQGRFLVFSDLSGEQAMLREMLKNMFFVGAAVFAAFLALSFFISIPVVRPAKEAFEQQRQFIADASHELKTPLTVILTNVQLMDDPDNTLDDTRQFSEAILISATRMKELVEKLLLLARTDARANHSTFRSVNFSKLCAHELMMYEPVFFEAGRMLTGELTESLQVSANEGGLEQVLDLLLENAAKYSTSNTETRMSLKRRGCFAELSVSNACSPVSSADLKNIFKRFYRIDKSRSSQGQKQGSGLGLAIVQSIVREHGGKIHADYAAGRIVFTITLPLVKSHPKSI